MKNSPSNADTSKFLLKPSIKPLLTNFAISFLSSIKLKIPFKFQSHPINSPIAFTFKVAKFIHHCTWTPNKRSITSSCSNSSSSSCICSSNSTTNNISRNNFSWGNKCTEMIFKMTTISKKMMVIGTNISTSNKTTQIMENSTTSRARSLTSKC